MQVGLKVLEEVDDLRLDRDIERTHGFIADDEFGPQSDRTSDGDPLSLASTELVRIAVRRSTVEPDGLEEFGRAGAPRRSIQPTHDLERLGDLVTDPHARVERGIGVLVDQLCAASEVG